MNILFIDNFDSFSHTLVDEFKRRGAAVQVWRNDRPVDELVKRALELPLPRLAVLSPGPGSPCEAGACLDLTRQLAGRVPVFGVCLGHQVIVEALGGRVGAAREILHGKTSRMTHDGDSFFVGLPNPMSVGRYHSLAVTDVPAEFEVRAMVNDTVMAVEHESLGLAGVQFHPESILTPQGGLLIEGIIRWAAEQCAAHEEAGRCAS